MKHAVLTIAALVAPTPAFAAPVHLECDLAGGPDGPVLRWQITVNEDERRVYYSHPQDRGRSPATFTADEVRFFGGDLRLNRNDLTVKRVVHLGGGEMMETTGQCHIAQRRRRAS